MNIFSLIAFIPNLIIKTLEKDNTYDPRKTIITLSLLRGMTPEDIKKISGHTSDKEFRKYLKVLDHWVEDQFHNAWR